MIRKFLQLSAVAIAFAGITSTASADDQSHKLDKSLFLGKYTMVDSGPILEEELVVTPSKNVTEEEISAPQYLWNRSTRTWQKNPRYCKASSTKTASHSRKS